MFRNKAQCVRITQRIVQQVEQIAPTVQSGVVPVWRDDSRGGRILVGTAFFAGRGERSFLVTALHNFQLNPGVALKVELLGAICVLNAMSARESPKDDLWVAEIGPDMFDFVHAIGSVPLIQRDHPSQCRFGTGSVLIGFPEGLNPQGEPFTQLAISTTLETRRLISSTTLPEALVFNVNDDFFMTAQGAPVMPRPEICGMSGGPVYSWYCSYSRDSNQISLHYFLQGMITSWRRVTGYIVACNAAHIAALVTPP